jgi:outer membrane protein OmpA-like peptidoglycan-associated protein
MPIRFEAGSARVAPESLRYLEALAAFLASSPEARLSIEGHTDIVGDPRINLVLSWERALSIYRLMVEKYRVEPAQLQPVGKGASEPMADSAPDDAKNRRVQFRLDQDRAG